jgi:Fe-S oxidoreductase
MSYALAKSLIVLGALLIAVSVFCLRLYRRLWVNFRHGQPSGTFGQWGTRIKGLLKFVGAQFRLFRVLLPGTAHFFIFWGFLILSLTILQAIVEGLLSYSDPHFVLPIIGTLGPLALLQDLFTIFVTVAVLYDLSVRLFVNPPRYEGSHNAQAATVLGYILTIMVSLSVMNGIRINLGDLPAPSWRPISALVGGLFRGLDPQAQFTIGEVAYWIHLGVVLLFLTELPEGKHFHVVTSIPAVLLRNLEPAGRLPAASDLDGAPGIGAIENFQWRAMLDFFTCTECGRCQDVCPAFASAHTLSPKLLIMSLRDHLKERGRTWEKRTSSGMADSAKAMLSDVVSEEALWACTTCYACDQECPLFIGHVPLIVDMRRRLVIDGHVDLELQNALANLGRYGNSFGQSERARARWTQTLDPKIKDARRESVEYLWFVGDYASYSPALTEITLKTAQVLQMSGLDFGILYEGERNAGNDVRRAGEEGLYEMLAEKNIGVLSTCSFEKIITTDPHSYNTLKNEYGFNGNGQHPVLHIAELLDQLIASGALNLRHDLGSKVTYHDPCYLGRYNGIYDSPRRVIRAMGYSLVEMPRHRDRAACCGAGGGRIWMKEGEMQERPSEARVREAISLDGVTTLVTTCPKDVSMFRDAVKTTGNEDRLVVRDLIDLVHAAL